MKNSLPGSLVAAIEASLTRAFDRYGAIAKFIVPSEFMRSLIVASGVDVDQVMIARYPVASDACFSVDSPSRPRFVYAGRLSPEKGLDVLLAASAKLRGRADIVLVGRGPLERALSRRIASERLPIEMCGFIDDPSVLRREFRRSTAMVVPSISYENAPMAVLEAASVGLPSVASKIGGIPEIVEHDVTGLLVPPGKAEPLASALENLAADAQYAASLGKNAWKRAQTTNDPDRYLRALLSCYTEVVGKHFDCTQDFRAQEPRDGEVATHDLEPEADS